MVGSIGPTPPSPSYNFSASAAETPNSIDHDPDFVHGGSALWEAYEQYNANPNDINIQALMQAVNKMSAYFTAHPPAPTQANNPKAYALYQAINNAPPGTPSLATQCNFANLSSTNGNSPYLEVRYLEQQRLMGVDMFAGVFNATNQIHDNDIPATSWHNRDLSINVNQTIHDDINTFKTDIETYNNVAGQEPAIDKIHLTNIAKDINKIMSESGEMKDGYLQSLTTLLGSRGLFTDSNSKTGDSLAVLAGKVTGANPTAADFDNFQKALNGQSSMLPTNQQPQNAASLDTWVSQVLQAEYKSSTELSPASTISSPAAATPGSMDTDPDFVHGGSALWEAYEQYKTNPNDINIQALMQAVNKMGAYFTAHPPAPTQAQNPHAFDLYQALNAGPPGAASLAKQCANYGDNPTIKNPDDSYKEVQYLQQQMKIGVDMFAGILNGTKHIYDSDISAKAWSNRDLTVAANKTIHDDIVKLQTDVQKYNNVAGKEPEVDKIHLIDIAGDINKIMSESGGIKDGYLQGLITLLGTRGLLTTDKTGDSLAALAAKVAGPTPTAADLDSFQKALNGQSSILPASQQPTNAASLDKFVSNVLANEYPTP